MAKHDSFKEGDFIEVTAATDTDDFGTIRGTAMDTRGQTGYADFTIEVNSDGRSQDLRFNLNKVNVKLLFSADHARFMNPNSLTDL